MIASSDGKLRKPPSSPSSASIRPFERPSSKGKDCSRRRPSTGSSAQSNKSREERRLVEGTGYSTVHVKSNLATLDVKRRDHMEHIASGSVQRLPTRPPTPVQAQSTNPDRGRPLVPSSSWSSLRFRPKSSKESSKEDPNDIGAVPSHVGNAGTSTIRRFQSLGFLRRKRSTSISVTQSPSNISLTSRSGGSSHGHSTSNSNSSNSSHSHPHQQQGQAAQPQPDHIHSVSASTVFPSLSRSSTFALTVTTGPSASSTNNPPPVSFARPPKANPVFRRSVSLYETSSTPKGAPTESTPLRRGQGSIKRSIPMPPTKTRTVARTPCTYDVTTVRPSRPRSSSLPLDPALQAVIASTSQSTSRSDDERTRSSHFSEAKEAKSIKAHGARRICPTRPLNTSSSLTDIFSSYTLTPMALRTPGTSLTATPRAHNRYAAVYRPPPPLDADGYARAGHPKPALSLSMPTGVSIIQSLPLSDSLQPPPVSSNTHSSRGHSSRNISPSSPCVPPFSSSLNSPSPLASPRPPPRAPVPESPGASPENFSKLLPSIPIISGGFSAAPSPTVTSPLRTNANRTPWARQRAHSTTRASNLSPSWVGAERPTSVATHNCPTNSNANSTSPKSTSVNVGVTSDKINYASGGRLGTSAARTIYINTPTIPISNQRRPSLPITPTASEFSHVSTSMDLNESLWGYFERSGLASPSKQSRELLRSRSANALSQAPSQNNYDTCSIYEATLGTAPLATTPRSKEASGRVSINMGKSVHSVYVSSPSGSGSHTPQTPNSSSLQTPPLTSDASPGSPYAQRRLPASNTAPKSNITSSSTSNTGNTIKLSSAHTIILREPPGARPQRAQRPTHLTSYSLPSPKADSFTIADPPAHSQVLYLDPARSYEGMNADSPSSFFNSPYPSPGVIFPVTPMTPMAPWIGSGKNGDADADSLVLPPSPRQQSI